MMNKKCENLVPDIPNPTPDYYCTWQTQLYATSDGKPLKQRACIGERQLFDKEKPYGWAYFYEKARQDLIFVMDDSWDVPLNGDSEYYGTLVLNKEKFPSFVDDKSDSADAMKALNEKIKSIGWKSVGAWICANKSSRYPDVDEYKYFIERLKLSEYAGWGYWKVDWGYHASDFEFRKRLSKEAHKHAPSVIIEHAIVKEIIPYSDAYRTYDVPAIMSIPMTMDKMHEFLDIAPCENEFSSIINCEDEVYIAASLGCSMGIMRNPYAGNLPNGKPDPSFPDCHRRLKTKLTEITRAVRWHKIAPAFGVDNENTYFSDTLLTDTWVFEDKEAEIEEWWLKKPQIALCMNGNTLTKTGCAAISRNMNLPIILPDDNGDVPYVTAAKNPNGSVSIATVGRTRNRRYWIPECTIEIEVGNADTFGVFGEYKKLVLVFAEKCDFSKILAQDLASDFSYDITDFVDFEENKAMISGDIIHNIGTFEQSSKDTSEPGVVIKFF